MGLATTYNFVPQQDTARPALSPYLQNYYRYLRSIEKDSLFHKKYNLKQYRLLQEKPLQDYSSNKLHFVKELPDSLLTNNPHPVITNEVPEFIKPDSLKTTISIDPDMSNRLTSAEKPSPIVKLDWYLGVLLFSIVFFAWIRFFFRKEIDRIFEAFFNNQTSHKIFLEQNTNTQRASFLLNTLFVVSLSFFLFFVVQFAGFSLFTEKKLLLFLSICGIIIIIYLLKYVVYKILGYIFISDRACNEYLHNVFLYSKAVGISLLPISIGLSYLPPHTHVYLLSAGGFLFAISFVARIYRGLQISSRSRVSVFYLFLYLCTLEIAPFLVLFKLLGIVGF